MFVQFFKPPHYAEKIRAYINHIKLWDSDFGNIVSKKGKVQDINVNQSKLEVNQTYKKDEKIKTKFEAFKGEDVVNKAHLDENLLQKRRTHFPNIKKKITMILKDLATNNLLKRFQFKELSQRLYKYFMTRVCLITMRKLMRF